MKKLCLVLVGLFCLFVFITPGHCFLDKVFKKGDPFERGAAAFQSADYETAIKEWRPLAEQGDTAAMYNVALSYEKKYSYKEAVFWYKKAAEKGDVDAQYKLGRIYEKSMFGTTSFSPDITKNNRIAAYWYTQAAQQGHDTAQYFLGELYRQGNGVLVDLEKARQLHTKAAYQGYDLAQLSLGDMCYDGVGGPKDAIHAYAWWSLYVSQNPDYSLSKYTKEKLNNLINQGIFIGKRPAGNAGVRLIMTSPEDYKQMTPKEIEEAKKLTKQLYNKIYGELRPED